MEVSLLCFCEVAEDLFPDGGIHFWLVGFFAGEVGTLGCVLPSLEQAISAISFSGIDGRRPMLVQGSKCTMGGPVMLTSAAHPKLGAS